MQKRLVSFALALAMVLVVVLPGCVEKEVERKHEVEIDVEGVVAQEVVVE